MLKCLQCSLWTDWVLKKGCQTSHYFGDLFLKFLLNNSSSKIENRNVGRIAAKCDNFLQYVRKAEKKLQINLNLSDSEIEEVLSLNEESHWRKLVAFYQYRALFALLIESIILTDRLLFVIEEGISQSFLLKLFDSTISPRCYALVAMK